MVRQWKWKAWTLMACLTVCGTAQSAPARHRAHKAKATVQLATPPVAQTALPSTASAEPPKPNWPALAKPNEPHVVWDSKGLAIDADNASLEKILEAVSTATGASVEGFDQDRRIFGHFGPGRARDVLMELLAGSGYNVVLSGDQGEGTPRNIELSVEGKAGAPRDKAARPDADDDDDLDDDQSVQPQQVLPPPPQRIPPQVQEQMQRRIMQHPAPIQLPQ